MIRLGNHIRLTSREVARFTHITGFAPDDVKTIEDLDASPFKVSFLLSSKA